MNFKKSKSISQSIRIVDVKKTVCLMLVATLFSTFSLSAQTVPDPPKPPKTNSSSSSAASYSVEIDTDDNQEHNSSVSISISDDSYKFRARYDKSKNEGVKAMLLEQLGKRNLTENGNTSLWRDDQNGNTIFEYKLTKGHLRMYIDTDLVSHGYSEKINNLGNDLRYFISGDDPNKKEAKAASSAKRELELAEKELARAKRELARAEGEAKRLARKH
jgi:hypothetical protein